MNLQQRSPRLKTQVTIEGVLATMTSALAIITLVNREWIEALTGLEPDGGNGTLEWLIVISLAFIAIVTATRAVIHALQLRSANP